MRLFTTCIVILFLLLTGCRQVSEEIDDIIDSEDKTVNNEQSKPYIEGNLKEYRPEVGSERIFMNGEDELYVQKVIAENEDYVQITISLSGAPTTHIYKWTNNELILVHENSSPANPDEDILESFTTMGELETFFHLNGNSDWEILSESETVTVPHGDFQDVYVIRKITDEVEDADTIYTRYFAPGIGLIKETYELTGEYGYKDEANLSIIK